MINKAKVRLTLIFIYLVCSLLAGSLLFVWTNVAKYCFIAEITTSIHHHFPTLEDEFINHINYSDCVLVKIGQPILDSYGYDKSFFSNQNRYKNMIAGILISSFASFIICLYLYRAYKRSKENLRQNKSKIWVWISLGTLVILVTLFSGCLLGGFANSNISNTNYDFLVECVGSLQGNHYEENKQIAKQFMESFQSKTDSSKGFEILQKYGYTLKDLSVNSLYIFIVGSLLSLLPLIIILLLIIDEYNE